MLYVFNSANGVQIAWNNVLPSQKAGFQAPVAQPDQKPRPDSIRGLTGDFSFAVKPWRAPHDDKAGPADSSVFFCPVAFGRVRPGWSRHEVRNAKAVRILKSERPANKYALASPHLRARFATSRYAVPWPGCSAVVPRREKRFNPDIVTGGLLKP
jgi:hypothetical protein